MLKLPDLLREDLYLGGGSLSSPLPMTEVYLGSDLFGRTTKDSVMVYYLDSSDQICIPGSYLNLFQILQTRSGDRLRESSRETKTHEFLSLGLSLPGILLHRTDSRGIRSILSRMVIIGTSGIRGLLPILSPWTLSNIHDTIEI